MVNIAEICARKEVRNIVLSPGSRCAPLTLAFVRHQAIKVSTFSDERSAAFIALGMAQQLKQPVGLVCTSGSAAYNYAPAIAEAFFQQIPLIVITADRPPEWIDQMDGQTIRQENIYQNHIKKSFLLPVSYDHKDAKWHGERIVSEAINLSRSFPQGPVHINVPLREPLYPAHDKEIILEKDVKIIDEIPSENKLNVVVKEKFINKFLKFNKVLIVPGQSDYDPELLKIIGETLIKFKVPVVADVISNFHFLYQAIRHHDLFLDANDADLIDLKPDLLITFGKSVISKNLKIFIRKNRPLEHWHLQKAGETPDTFQSLTHIIREEAATFFTDLNKTAPDIEEKNPAYFDLWQENNNRSRIYLKDFFSSAEFGEFKAVDTILKNLPSCNLHVSNSMPVRYLNYINMYPDDREIKINVNRGTSGIDGSNSTAVGASLATKKSTVLLTGDMAFFYDRNAFWHNYPLPNLKVIILNNHAGGIFRIIDGPANLPELEEYFETFQSLNARNLAEEFQFGYHACHDQIALKETLKSFFSIEKTQILEIFSNSKKNHSIFKSFKEGCNN